MPTMRAAPRGVAAANGKTILLRVLELLDKSSKEKAELKEAVATRNKTISELQSSIRE
jgi:hypothetical protein